MIFRQKAIDDLSGIWGYTARRWSEKQADKYYEMIKLACDEIEMNAEIGRRYDGIIEGIRG